MIYPKITIVTPSFNQGKYLEDTLLSVINQKYPNLEYIVIDGGSTDNSIEIIKKYEPQLTYWISETDKGLYDAIQKGFERSTGDIMAWINSDDMYHQKSLLTVAEIFEVFPKVNWLMGQNTFYNEFGQAFIMDDDTYHERWSKWRMYNFEGKFIQQESVFWRRELWEKAGGYIDKKINLAGDFDLWLRFFRYENLYSTTFLLSGFRFRNENQKSNNNFKEYISQTQKLLLRENQIKNHSVYVVFCKLIILISKAIIIKKYRNMLIHKVLKFPSKIIYLPRQGYFLRKLYHLS